MLPLHIVRGVPQTRRYERQYEAKTNTKICHHVGDDDYRFFAIALGLIASQGVDSSPGSDSLDLSEATGVDYSDLPSSLSFTARDGSELAYRRYESARQTNRILILVHGSAWHGMQFHAMAGELAARGVATVIAPDMRGHGAKPARRGDVDHSDQLEDDMSDLIDYLSQGVSEPEIILGGHSSGGGFVVCFAGGAHAAKADAFILLAPFLKYNAPTTRENSGGWARPATRRIIGLAMLNMVGITALNHLEVIGFAMPQFVLSSPYGYTATRRYTYRMTSAFAPRADYEGAILPLSTSRCWWSPAIAMRRSLPSSSSRSSRPRPRPASIMCCPASATWVSSTAPTCCRLSRVGSADSRSKSLLSWPRGTTGRKENVYTTRSASF